MDFTELTNLYKKNNYLAKCYINNNLYDDNLVINLIKSLELGLLNQDNDFVTFCLEHLNDCNYFNEAYPINYLSPEKENKIKTLLKKYNKTNLGKKYISSIYQETCTIF